VLPQAAKPATVLDVTKQRGFQMAKFLQDGPNLRLELDHNETDSLIKEITGAGAVGTAGVTTLLVTFHVPAFVAPIVAAFLVIHATWEIAAIKASDKGQGVFLTAPGFFARVVLDPVGAAILLIPSTRYEFDNDGWSTKDDDVVGSSEGDVIQTHIDHTGDPKTVVFRLSNQSPEGWDKAFVLRDGLGGEWWVQAKGYNQAENGLWADQVHNGQPISFWKPKFLNAWTEIFSVSHLERLMPGSIVTFTWTKD